MENDLESKIDLNKNNYIFIVAGLLYGDEGKGTTVEFLFDKIKSKDSKNNLVVRYCGGPQAAHHIVLKDKTFHCFSSFCSSSFDKSSYTLISKYVLISPTNLKSEYDVLIKKGVNLKDRLYIDEECYIITPYHKLLNRVMEKCLTPTKCLGSTGQGVGVTMEDIYYSDANFFPLCSDKTNDELNINIRSSLSLNDENINLDKYKDENENDNTYFSFIRNNKENLTLLKVKDMTNEEELRKKIKLIKTQKLKQIKFFTEKYPKMKEEINNLVLSTLKNNPEEKIVEFYINFSREFSHCFTSSLKIIYDHLKNGKNIIFEGAQGMLLDRNFGFSPHITKSSCTDINVKALLKEISEKYSYDINHKILKIGVLRSFSSRHGNGPFISLNNSLEIKEPHNSFGNWQGEFKIGDLDILALKYGINIFQPDYLSVTWLDEVKKLHIIKDGKLNLKYIDKYCFSQLLNEDKEINNNINDVLEKLIENKLLITENQENKIIINAINPNKIDIFNNFMFTNFIKKCDPIYSYYEISVNKEIDRNDMSFQFLSFLEKMLGKKVLIQSFGPTKEDKIINKNILIY